jgi:hypothetical protein
MKKYLLLAATLLLAACNPTTPQTTGGDSSSSASMQTYTDTKYGFSFEYSSAYTLKPQEGWVNVLTNTSDTASYVTVFIEPDGLENIPSTEPIDLSTVQPTVLMRYCGADGVMGSTHCTGIDAQATIVTANGLKGEKYYLTMVEENFSQKTRVESVVGPFYVFITPLPDSATRGFLIVNVGLNRESTPEAVELARSIVDTLTIPTAEPSSAPGKKLSKEGEFCGGIAGFMCEKGLTCQMEGNYPDAGGTCVKE